MDAPAGRQSGSGSPLAERATGTRRRGVGTVLLTGLCLSLILTAGAHYWRMRIAEHVGERLVALAGAERRVEALAHRVTQAATGAEEHLNHLLTAHERLAGIFEQFGQTDTSERYPKPLALAAKRARVASRWAELSQSVQVMLAQGTSVRMLTADIRAFQSVAASLLLVTDELVRSLVAAEAPAAQVATATRQLLLIQRIGSSLEAALADRDALMTTLDRFGRDVVLFGQVVNGLMGIAEGGEVESVEDEAARERLRDLASVFRERSALVGTIMENAGALVALRNAAESARRIHPELLAELGELRSAYATLLDSRSGVDVVAWAGAVASLALLLLAWSPRRVPRVLEGDTSPGAQTTMPVNMQRNERAVQRLLRELDRVAAGDLTVRDDLDSDFSPTVARALQQTLATLRARLFRVATAAQEVAHAARGTVDVATRCRAVGDAGENRTAATEKILKGAALDAALQACEQAFQASRVAEDTFTSACDGEDGLTQVSASIRAVQQVMTDSGHRLQHLDAIGCSIAEATELTSDIANQGHVLALNTAIQASGLETRDARLGAVADQLQRLSQRFAEAGRHLEQLNERLAADTRAFLQAQEAGSVRLAAGLAQTTDVAVGLRRIARLARELSSRWDRIGEQTRHARDAHVLDPEEARSQATMARGLRTVTASAVELGDRVGRLLTALAAFDLGDPHRECGLTELSGAAAAEPPGQQAALEHEERPSHSAPRTVRAWLG